MSLSSSTTKSASHGAEALLDIALYDRSAFAMCCALTRQYSTSFTIGIRCFHKQIRPAIYAIYAFARLTDEIVDSFHTQNQNELLHEFKAQTKQALKRRFSTHPVLHAFQHTLHTYGIETHLIDAFFNSMEMDLHTDTHNQNSYERYVYGSAEAIGLMVLRVYCHQNPTLHEQLVGAAKQLGAAFQKVNFLRDMRADYQLRKRIYFPNLKWDVFTKEVKKKLEDEIEKHFHSARLAILELPSSSRWGIKLSYLYYVVLFRKIKRHLPEDLQKKRLRISNILKVWWMVYAYFSPRLPKP